MKFKYLFLVLLSLLMVASCKNKKQGELKDSYIRPASMDFTKQDTTDIMGQLNNYVASVKAKDYNAAVQNLYIYEGGDSIRPLDGVQKEHALETYKHLNVYDCAVNALMLKGETENMAKVALQIVKSGDLQKGIGVTYVTFRPVKVNNKWYITFMDNESLRASEDK